MTIPILTIEWLARGSVGLASLRMIRIRDRLFETVVLTHSCFMDLNCKLENIFFKIIHDDDRKLSMNY